MSAQIERTDYTQKKPHIMYESYCENAPWFVARVSDDGYAYFPAWFESKAKAERYAKTVEQNCLTIIGKAQLR